MFGHGRLQTAADAATEGADGGGDPIETFAGVVGVVFILDAFVAEDLFQYQVQARFLPVGPGGLFPESGFVGGAIGWLPVGRPPLPPTPRGFRLRRFRLCRGGVPGAELG